MSNVYELNRQIYSQVGNKAVDAGTVTENTITTPTVVRRAVTSPAPAPATTTPAAPAAPATPAAPALSEEEMLAIVAPNLYSYHTKYDEAVEQSEKPQQIFMAFNGVFARRTEKFNDNVISVITEMKKVPGLRSMKEGILVDLKNKLPFSIFEELVANYRAIYMRDKTESAAQIYRLKEEDSRWPGKKVGDYVVYYPVQENTGAHTAYDKDPEAVINLRQKHTLVMESHAHANFNAFFSGGDDSNEKAPLAYCVIGNVAGDRVSFAGRVKLLNKEKRMDVDELFDVPAEVTTPLVVSSMTLPAPSLQMLENAKPASSTHVKTAAELAEERMKNGIVIPERPTSNFRHGVYGSGDYGSGDYGYGYYGRANYGKHYSSGTYNNKYDYGNYSAKSAAKADRKKNKALMKLDLEWIADNLSDMNAVELLELLTKRVEKIISDKTGGNK